MSTSERVEMSGIRVGAPTNGWGGSTRSGDRVSGRGGAAQAVNGRFGRIAWVTAPSHILTFEEDGNVASNLNAGVTT